MTFSYTPLAIGSGMALIDICMMTIVKMVSVKRLQWGVAMPIAVFLYAMEPLIFLKAMKYEGMAVTNLVWNLMSNVIVTLQGVFIFGESIKGLRWLGIAMSLVSLTLLAYVDD